MGCMGIVEVMGVYGCLEVMVLCRGKNGVYVS
jgi:hypothetical protein